MLPIFRLITVGGVSLAIAILVLALVPPGGSHLVLAQHQIIARGALMDASRHPEWRQFLFHAALRRAEEVRRLRSPPESGAGLYRTSGSAKTYGTSTSAIMAGLSAASGDDVANDFTGSISEDPNATMSIDIGETSSTELPLVGAEEKPPVIRVPALQVPVSEAAPVIQPVLRAAIKKSELSKRVVQQRSRRKRVAPETDPTAAVPPPFNFLAAIFGGLAKADAGAQPPARRPTATSLVRRSALGPGAIAQ